MPYHARVVGLPVTPVHGTLLAVVAVVANVAVAALPVRFPINVGDVTEVVALIVPLTSSFAPGVEVPIPTFDPLLKKVAPLVGILTEDAAFERPSTTHPALSQVPDALFTHMLSYEYIDLPAAILPAPMSYAD